ncbi:hypothetical protein BC828DRAFT_63436, partial [Blastocladiella britannica]
MKTDHFPRIMPGPTPLFGSLALLALALWCATVLSFANIDWRLTAITNMGAEMVFLIFACLAALMSLVVLGAAFKGQPRALLNGYLSVLLVTALPPAAVMLGTSLVAMRSKVPIFAVMALEVLSFFFL